MMAKVFVYRFHTFLVTFMSEHFESIPAVNIKVRRVLKGHQGKVLSLAWSLDKRHVVSSSQVT